MPDWGIPDWTQIGPKSRLVPDWTQIQIGARLGNPDWCQIAFASPVIIYLLFFLRNQGVSAKPENRDFA